VRYPAVSVREVVLGDQDALVGKSQSEGHNKMDDAREAPTIYHLWVLGHIDAIVDGSIGSGDFE
jgi:hypothetical protein